MRHADAGYPEAHRGGAAPRRQAAGHHRLRRLARMRIVPDLALIGGRFARDVAVEVTDGRITAVTPGPSDNAPDTVRLAGKALMPGTVNAHCHSFQSLLRGFGDDLDFMDGATGRSIPTRRGSAARASTSARPSRSPRCSSRRHHLRRLLLPQGRRQRERGGGDRSGARHGHAPRPRPRYVRLGGRAPALSRDARRRRAPLRELIHAHAGDHDGHLQPAPHSPHGASEAMIRAGGEVAEAADKRFHIHLAEEKYEGERTLAGTAPRRPLSRQLGCSGRG